jgi:hypothetical protein
MLRRAPELSDDVTVYLILNDYRTGLALWRRPRRRRIAKPSSGTFSAANAPTPSEWSSEDIAGDVLQRAFDADENLGGDTKRFIDRHMVPGEKRPPAPSVRRDTGAEHLRVGGRKSGQWAQPATTTGSPQSSAGDGQTPP